MSEGMRVHRLADPATFLGMAAGFLVANETVRNLPFSVARHCIDDPGRYPGPNYFAVVAAPDGIEGVAVMTTPYLLQAFVEPGPGIPLLVDDLMTAAVHVPGVIGPAPSARAFAVAWSRHHAVRELRRHQLRAFELTAVTPAPPVPGTMRPAHDADLPTVQAWYRSFEREADLSDDEDKAAEHGARALRAGRVFLWDHGGAVAQAALVGTTPRGVRIGMVYTPPAHRRHGYATALVGALSQQCLRKGRAFCCLFTDLANPVSNAIYPRVGYRPVADFEEIAFVAAS